MKESGEMYLETIYELKLGEPVKSVEVAKKLDVSKPSVNKAINSLIQLGYVEKGLYSEIKLTATGIEKAREIMRKHRIITDFLMLSLSLDHETAENDACRIEHIISEETFKRITAYVQNKKDNPTI